MRTQPEKAASRMAKGKVAVTMETGVSRGSTRRAVHAALLPTGKVLLIAGPPSHPPGMHEHNAGVILLQKCLARVPGLKTDIVLGGWPADPAKLEGLDAVIFYCDGQQKHVALQDDRKTVLGRVLAKGAGLGLLHYAVEPTLDDA